MSELSDERVRELLRADEMPDTSRMAPVNFELFVMVLQKRLAEARDTIERLTRDRNRLGDTLATLRDTVGHLQDQPDLGLPLDVNVGEGAARVIRELRAELAKMRGEHRHCWSDDRHREEIRAEREMREAEKAAHAETRECAQEWSEAATETEARNEQLQEQFAELSERAERAEALLAQAVRPDVYAAMEQRAERAEVRAEIAEGLTPEEVAAFRDGLIPATGDPVDDVRALAKIVLVREKEREAQEAVTLQQVERAERAEAEVKKYREVAEHHVRVVKSCEADYKARLAQAEAERDALQAEADNAPCDRYSDDEDPPMMHLPISDWLEMERSNAELRKQIENLRRRQ